MCFSLCLGIGCRGGGGGGGLFGYWARGGGGGQAGLVHNVLMQFFSLYSSKIEVSKTQFFDVVIA